MKMYLIALLLPFYLSCVPPVEVVTPGAEETGIVGQWQEIGHIIPLLDSLHQLIDSVDENALYTFRADSTFTAIHDFYLNGETGVWSIGSASNTIRLEPLVSPPPIAGQRNHEWIIISVDANQLKVQHHYEFYTPQTTGGTHLDRTFIRI